MRSAAVLQFPPMARTERSTGKPDTTPNRVRYWRKRLGMTMEELAEKVGLHFTHLGKIERGERDLNQQWMVRIAEAMEVEPADLLLLEDGGLSDEERDLVNIYRHIPASLRTAFDALRESHRQFIGSGELIQLRDDQDQRKTG